MRIFALTVGRNEADRYLAPMLRHMHDIVDGHFFYDDQSDDETVELATAAGCTVRTRADTVPSFVENEGAFREAAWNVFQAVMSPMVGDWVLVIDCDEVLVSSGMDERRTLEAAAMQGVDAVTLNIPEVFGFDGDGCPLIRTDGAWPTIHAPRYFGYKPGGTYFHGEFGVPAVPSYAQAARRGSADTLSLMHYGYADGRDKAIKYERYSGHFGHGHQHVQSIITKPELVRWGGPYVKEMRRATNG